jgi:hypothetical protein
VRAVFAGRFLVSANKCRDILISQLYLQSEELHNSEAAVSCALQCKSHTQDASFAERKLLDLHMSAPKAVPHAS